MRKITNFPKFIKKIYNGIKSIFYKLNLFIKKYFI